MALPEETVIDNSKHLRTGRMMALKNTAVVSNKTRQFKAKEHKVFNEWPFLSKMSHQIN